MNEKMKRVYKVTISDVLAGDVYYDDIDIFIGDLRQIKGVDEEFIDMIKMDLSELIPDEVIEYENDDESVEWYEIIIRCLLMTDEEYDEIPPIIDIWQ